jgi:hypothetical protein
MGLINVEDEDGVTNGTATDPVEKGARWHLLVSQVGLHFQQQYPSSLPAFPESELNVNAR